MGNENQTPNNSNLDFSQKNADKDVSEDENQYSIYNYVKSHPGSLAIIFSSMVAVITFFAQITAFINNKNALEYWNIDGSYALWNSNGLLYSALTSIVYVIVVSVLTTWFSKVCDAYLEHKNLFVTCKLVYKRFNKQYKSDKAFIYSIASPKSISANKLEETKKHLEAQKENLKKLKLYTKRIEHKSKNTFILNLLPITGIFILLVVIKISITSSKKDLFITALGIFIIQIIIYWLSFLIMQSVTIKKQKIKEMAEKVTSDYIESLGNFKKEYPISSLLKKGGKITNISFVSQLLQTVILCLSLIFSLALIGGSEESKKTFQIVNIDNQQYVVVFHEEETYYLEKAVIDGDKLEVYTDNQRIITTSDISFSIKKFDEVVRKESGTSE